jgi:NAD(P)-dependent dehydrogenase (short-subunit alcohol dehydrogenase family)
MGDQAREIVGAPTGIGRRLTNAIAHMGQTEHTVLLENPEALDVELVQEEEAEAKAEAERPVVTEQAGVGKDKRDGHTHRGG